VPFIDILLICNAIVINKHNIWYILILSVVYVHFQEKNIMYSGGDKSLARTGRKQATATEDFDVHISYL